MAWTVYGEPFVSDSDYNNGVNSIKVKMHSNQIVTVCRTWIVMYNNPGVTNFKMKICYDNNGSIGEKLADATNILTKAEVITAANGVKEIYFNFDKISLFADKWYHFVLYGDSTGLSESAHIAWKSSYPYPVYTTGVSMSQQFLPKFPFDVSFVGAEF